MKKIGSERGPYRIIEPQNGIVQVFLEFPLVFDSTGLFLPCCTKIVGHLPDTRAEHYDLAYSVAR